MNGEPVWILVEYFHIGMLDMREQKILVTTSTKNNIIITIYPIVK